MSDNGNLHGARNKKDNEFYTHEKAIHEEVIKYKNLLKGKHIYCNCDDANWSNFWWYFYSNANIYEIASITATCYNENGHGEYWYYSTDNQYSKERMRDELKRRAQIKEESNSEIISCEMFDNVEHKILEGNGSFDSPECLKILDDADIIITNPPFSLFRDYVSILVKHNKQFLIIGDMKADAYKEIFPLIKNNTIWHGYNYVKTFTHQDGSLRKFGNILWYTNLETNIRNNKEEFYSHYDPSKYPRYSNYDAIECKFVSKIPGDYSGIIGVPITFIDHYCPDQFDIIDINPHFFSIVSMGLKKPDQLHIPGQKKDPFVRLLIRWKPEAMPKIKENGEFSYDY